MAAADVVVCQGVPQQADLVAVSLDALPNDRVHLERLNLRRVLRAEFAQLVPQLANKIK